MAPTPIAATDRRTRLEDREAQEAQLNSIRMDTIQREGREPTAEEAAAIQASFATQDRLRAERTRLAGDDEMMDTISRLSGGDAAAASGLALRRPRAGQLLALGSQFVKGSVYEELKKTRTRGNGWQSVASDELHLYAATLTEDPASGGALVQPTYRPGIVPLATPALTIADLFAPGVTNSNQVVSMVEKTITNAADAVAEGTLKPESAITFEQKAEPVRKIATWIPASEEILEDVAGLASYLNIRLTLFVRLEEEDQLLNGSGVAPNLVGILARAGLAAPVVRTDPETNADALARQIFSIQNATNLPVSGLVLNPVNWEKIILTKNTDGSYHGDGEFAAPNALSLWGVPVALSSRITVGTGLVGAFQTGAQIFRRGGVVVQATNAHQDFFTKNLVAIRAEERLALAVYRPGAFGLCSGLQ